MDTPTYNQTMLLKIGYSQLHQNGKKVHYFGRHVPIPRNIMSTPPGGNLSVLALLTGNVFFRYLVMCS